MSGRPTSSTTSRGWCVRIASSPASPGRRLQDPEPVAGEVEVDEVGDVRLVVDDDDGAPFHGAQSSHVGRRERVRGL